MERTVLRDDHAVNADAGDADVARREHVAPGHALHLHDHDPARVLGRLSDRERVERGRLPFHRHVPVLVGSGPAREGDVDRLGGIEQVLLPVELQQPDDLGTGDAIHAAAVEAGVDEGSEADTGDQPRAAGSGLSVEMRDDALRKAVGLDPLLECQRAERGDKAPTSSCSGTPRPTKPPTASVSPSRTNPAAMSGEISLVRRPALTAPC